MRLCSFAGVDTYVHAAQDVRKQLLQTMDRYKLDLVSAGRDQKKILMAVTSGFFFHAARKDPQEVRSGLFLSLKSAMQWDLRAIAELPSVNR